MSETLTRTVSGTVLGVLVLGALLWGGLPSYLLWAVIVIGVSVEWARLVYKGINRCAARILFFVVGTLLYIISFLSLGILIQPEFSLLMIYLFGLVWSIDVGAYFTGRYFGGKKLAPSISPGKTWSGFFGGLLFGIFFTGVCIYLVEGGILGDFSDFWLWIPFSFCASVVAQLGDLYESKAKRFAGVKDSSHLIPGHGGILDRLDSLLAVIPFTALYFIVMLYVHGWPEQFPH